MEMEEIFNDVSKIQSKTRKSKKASNKLIVRRRNAK